MSKFEIRGHDLYDARKNKVATSRGRMIFGSDNKNVARVDGDHLYDTEGRKMASLHGSDIFDADNKKVGSFSDVEDSIEGAMEGILDVALWYCFVR